MTSETVPTLPVPSERFPRTLAEAAAELRDGRLTSVELVAAVLARLDQVGAGREVLHGCFKDRAMVAAARADDRLHRAPVASRLLGVPVAAAGVSGDALGARAARAGAVLVGEVDIGDVGLAVEHGLAFAVLADSRGTTEAAAAHGLTGVSLPAISAGALARDAQDCAALLEPDGGEALSNRCIEGVRIGLRPAAAKAGKMGPAAETAFRDAIADLTALGAVVAENGEADVQLSWPSATPPAPAPAVVIPIGRAGGRPLTMEMTTEPGRQALLFAIAESFQYVTDWHCQPPGRWHDQPRAEAR